MMRPWVAVALLCLFSGTAWPRTFQLFSKPGQPPVSDNAYKNVVDHLKYGDIVAFSNGRNFTVGKLLGTGNTTLIYSLVGDRKHVLRIPKYLGPFQLEGEAPKDYSTKKFITWFIEGANEMERDHIPVVHIEESLDDEYIEVDRLESDMISFGDFASHFNAYASGDRAKMIAAMDRFLVASARMSEISDLHDGNLVYLPHKNEWIIADISSGSEELDPAKRLTIRSRSVLNDLTQFLDVRTGSRLDKQIQRWKKIVRDARKGNCDFLLQRPG